jgi:uncharacterized protein YyaL (SSP411 family)
VFGRALDRLRLPVKVTTRNPSLAQAAIQSHPYAVIDPNGDDRAVVCVGTICLAPVSTPGAVGEALQEAARARA